jgi:hypothetical protein
VHVMDGCGVLTPPERRELVWDGELAAARGTAWGAGGAVAARGAGGQQQRKAEQRRHAACDAAGR